MIDLPEARAIAGEFLQRTSRPPYEDEDYDLAIIEELTITAPDHFVFFYQTRAFIASGNPMDGIIGNAPILVDRRSGQAQLTGTALPLDAYIEAWKRTGDCSSAYGR